MNSLYRSPLRVYLILGALGLWGILSGLGLSISLFPMSSQSTVAVNINYGSYSSSQFYESIGQNLEGTLKAIKVGGVSVVQERAFYEEKQVQYRLKFNWGVNPDEALRAVENRVNSVMASYEEAIRKSVEVYSSRQNQGFFAASFYSPMRSLDEIHQILNPMVTAFSGSIQDAERVGVYNPNQKEITIRILPERLAQMHLSTMQVDRSLRDAIFSLNGGSLKMGEKEYEVSLPKRVSSPEQLENVRVSPVGQEPVLLKDVAQVSVAPTIEASQRFKTSGVESLILFASPKEGGNIKRMSDEISANLAKLQIPADIQFKVLVNPSEFIDKSIRGVLSEVGLAALLAVLVLFAFIGNIRNVITAAIEIPLSLVMAFILMRFAGMNLNLISLGGLALSAGMNVDASVVVLENIFRHFEGEPKNLSYEEKFKIVSEAVAEVRLPIVASTIASLVVFLPLVFTKGLTNALLGDLAKAVIFSHGLSAVVALFLVPTIRLHILSKGEVKHSVSPLERYLEGIENFYQKSLKKFLGSTKAQIGLVSFIVIALPMMVFLLIPKLKREIIGKPESDWLIAGVSSPLITNAKQMEAEIEDLEFEIQKKFGQEIAYTFTEIQGASNGYTMLRLKNREKVEEMQSKYEEAFKNTPTKFYWVEHWNPSELRIPEPPEYRIELTGGTAKARQLVGQDLSSILREERVFDTVSTEPSVHTEQAIVVEPNLNLGAEADVLNRYDLAHFLRVATVGAYVDRVFSNGQELSIYLRMPVERAASTENLASIPVGFDGRLIPLGALARFAMKEKAPREYRENQRSLVQIDGKLKKDEKIFTKERVKQAHQLVEDYRKKMDKTFSSEQPKDRPTIVEVAPDVELREALDQLTGAIALSILLIFLVMVIQLGDVVHSLLVLVSIPLGFLGVISSLYLFHSSLSLNSGLGTILLNGIAVANSIILVDFIRRLHESGLTAMEATVQASRARLRPILMTSLTTGLGMMPVAMGMGEGGKTLQPLGIAVCGGLWVSTLLTLYLVPCLQYLYLKRKHHDDLPIKYFPSTVKKLHPEAHA